MLKAFDERRKIAIPGNKETTLDHAADHWAHLCLQATQKRGVFRVALSGGSTPNAIFERLRKKELPWKKIALYWSDERTPPEETNASMALRVLRDLPFLAIHPLTDPEQYDQLIRKEPLDLIMLGCGEDGHTASLFPHTPALLEKERWVVANPVPGKKSLRFTFTYPALSSGPPVVIYALGKSKASIVKEVLTTALYPASLVGSADHPALWFLDQEAASELPN
jgi:6-phosphogluconolactonase